MIPSDPPEDDLHSSSAPLSTINQPLFFLYCNRCGWDSADIKITFEKPTGLASTYTVCYKMYSLSIFP